jgi:hypothetical protein
MGVPVWTIGAQSTEYAAGTRRPLPRGRVYTLPPRGKHASKRGAASYTIILAIFALFLAAAVWQSVQIGRLSRQAQAVGDQLAHVTQERVRIIGASAVDPENLPENLMMDPLL